MNQQMVKWHNIQLQQSRYNIPLKSRPLLSVITVCQIVRRQATPSSLPLPTSGGSWFLGCSHTQLHAGRVTPTTWTWALCATWAAQGTSKQPALYLFQLGSSPGLGPSPSTGLQWQPASLHKVKTARTLEFPGTVRRDWTPKGRGISAHWEKSRSF